MMELIAGVVLFGLPAIIWIFVFIVGKIIKR